MLWFNHLSTIETVTSVLTSSHEKERARERKRERERETEKRVREGDTHCHSERRVYLTETIQLVEA